MIVTLGLFSIIQLVFLPGLIISRLAKLHGVGNTALVSIALSPIINYLFVFSATALGIYNQTITLLFFGIEVIILFYLMLPTLNQPLSKIFDHQLIISFFMGYLYKNNRKFGWSEIFSKTILVIIFFLSLYVILHNASIYNPAKEISIFSDWDAVFSWDRWAVDWYENHFPNSTWHYPQLIPANWSLTYKFMGDSRIKLFAKNFMGFIEIYILLIIFILGIIKRKAGYFLGVIFVSGLQKDFGSQGNGYVDSAVAFFALSSLACLLIAEKKDDRYRPAYIYIGAVVAAGAAVTKQAGLWIILVYPLLLIFTEEKKENRQSLYRYLPGILMIYAFIIFPWYGYKEFQIQTGRDASEVSAVTLRAVQDRNWSQQIENSFLLIQKQLDIYPISGKFFLAIFSILMIFSISDRFYLFLLGLGIIPFTLFWALYFNYDARNLNLVVPLIGLTAGIGLSNLFDWLKNLKILAVPIRNIKSIKGFYLLILVFPVFFLPFRYSDSYLINKSIALQKEIGYPQMNQKLYKYQSKNEFNGLILTDWPYLDLMPGIAQYYRFGESSNPSTFLEDINDPQVGYVLLYAYFTAPEVNVFVNKYITQGDMEIIFEEGPFSFITTCHGPCEQ